MNEFFYSSMHSVLVVALKTTCNRLCTFLQPTGTVLQQCVLWAATLTQDLLPVASVLLARTSHRATWRHVYSVHMQLPLSTQALQ